MTEHQTRHEDKDHQQVEKFAKDDDRNARAECFTEEDQAEGNESDADAVNE